MKRTFTLSIDYAMVIFLMGIQDAAFLGYELLMGEALAVGFWMMTIGYYFLIFTYLFLNRYWFKSGEERRIYWLAFSLFFIFLAAGRVFHVTNDFFFEFEVLEKMGVSMQWFSTACMAVVVAVMLVENESISAKIGYLFIIPPIVIGVLYLIVPPDWIHLIMSNGMISIFYIACNATFYPIYAIAILFLFFWTAKLIPGKIRTNSILSGIGFMIMFAGRLLYSQVGEIVVGIIRLDFPISIAASSLIIVSLILFAYSTRE